MTPQMPVEGQEVQHAASRFDAQPGLATPEDFRRAAYADQYELLRTDVFDTEERERIERRIARFSSMARRLEWMAAQRGRAGA
ncbi:hypothetical protein GGQ86_000822 [Xanthobacter flavus]|uniref:Uncharacterized protein n=1 Tax=Xanthobacter flavus TaxID=281 RepID=A0A9W6CKQ8_XANFL|nr:hypothetical protein [Xanthobacter flavus]MDR6332375.1 hypothetical protein [Xanthobacter flavus]GLI21876.1 hypothetical protein XFLAVUS301_15500 [Xanthobacter flavus]